MARVSRLIIYDSDDEEALKEQIEKSLPEGVHEKAVKITIIDIVNGSILASGMEKLILKIKYQKR